MTTRAAHAAQPAAVPCPQSLCIPPDRCGAPALDGKTNLLHTCSGSPHYGEHSCPCEFAWTGEELPAGELRKLVDETVKLYGMAFTVGSEVLDPSQIVIHGADSVTEYGQLMSGGGVHVRNPHPEIERVSPLAEWITANRRFGGKVLRRRVIVVEDWVEVTEP